MSCALLNPIPDWPALRVALCHAVFCETWEQPFERLLSDLVVDLCSPLFLQDCVAVNTQDVVDAADTQTLSGEGELRSCIARMTSALLKS